MADFKKLIVLALVLTFLGGMGAGAWIGSLSAKPEAAPAGTVERRLADFQQAISDLTPSQQRQLRTVLMRHDQAITTIQQRVSAEQFRAKLAEEAKSREAIREILTEDQRTKYDNLTGRK